MAAVLPPPDSDCRINVTERPADDVAAAARAPERQASAPRVEDGPGVLRGGATLTLQTRQAQRLVKGRDYTAEKPAIMGLFGSANLLRTMWHGARADDPYADWWLLKVHEAQALGEHALVAAEQAVATRFQAMGSIDVTTPVSVTPVRIALNFNNPYAFRAARLVGLYDSLVRTLLSARHVGLLTREASERLLHVGGRQIRRALQSPVGYRYTGVTRLDVEQGTAKALQAKDVMGELPDDVRTAERRAPYAPARATSTTAVAAEHIQPQP